MQDNIALSTIGAATLIRWRAQHPHPARARYFAPRAPTPPPPAAGVIEERRSSPGLLLALLGQDAMRRLRDAHTAQNLMPRQFQLLALLADHGPMGQRELGRAM